MIKITNTKNENCNVEILKNEKEFTHFKLSFLGTHFDTVSKTLFIMGKETYEETEITEVFSKIYKTLVSFDIKEASIDARGISDYLQIVNGLILASYVLKKDKATTIDISLILDDENVDLNEYITLANNQNFAKDLVNTSPNKMTPLDFVNKAKEIFKEKVDIEVISDINETNYGGLFAVGKGSVNKPLMLVLRYKPLENNEIFGLIGKGVTFDTGGYCLKPPTSMPNMKGDMAGAAHALASFKSVVDMNLEKNVTCVIPLCENRISHDATLPGDIITMYDGTTVEILNTDAEGRLILGDAVTHAIKNENVSSIVEMATLTGAAVVGFGFTMTPLISDSDELFESLSNAASITHDKFVRLPFYKEHKKMLESDMADLKNIGGPQCGCITGGLFVKHFSKDTPFMHLDIAGSSFSERPLYEYNQKGATGAITSSIYYMIKN